MMNLSTVARNLKGSVHSLRRLLLVIHRVGSVASFISFKITFCDFIMCRNEADDS